VLPSLEILETLDALETLETETTDNGEARQHVSNEILKSN